MADGFLGHAMGTLGATSAMVLWLDADDVLRTLACDGRSGDGADQYQEMPLAGDLPGAVAARSRTDVHFRIPSARSWPPSRTWLATTPRTAACTCCRCTATPGPGLLALTFPSDLFTAAEDGFLHSLAGALTSAVLRAAELQEQDAATQRTVLLAEASMSLSRSLDMDITVAEVGRLLVPRFADWCNAAAAARRAARDRAVQHRDPATTEWARR